MNRTELENYILNTYNARHDYPWAKFPDFEVFRHPNNKWFALIMDLQKSKLGLSGTEMISIVNLKCSPLIMGSLTAQKGIFPAYHMNKEHWVTVALDGSVPDDELKMLIGISYDATSPKMNSPKGPKTE